MRWAPPGERLLAPGPTTAGVPGNLAFFTPEGAITSGPPLPVVPNYPYGVVPTQPNSGGEGFDFSAGSELVAGVYSRACLAPPGGAPEPICTSSDIFVGLRRVTYRGGESPSWSPHGQWIAFTRNTRRVSALKDPDIFVVRRDGSHLRRLTRRGGVMPVWSPDGSQIAFLRDGNLYTISSRGGTVRRYGRYGSKDNFPWFVSSLDWQAR